MMKRFLSLCLMAFPTSLLAAEEAVELAPFEARSVVYSGGDYDNETFHYLLLKPETMEEGKRYPLVLFLHGAGERGDDNRVQLKHFPEHFRDPEYRKRFPCFLLAPQCRTDQRWANYYWDGSVEPPADSLSDQMKAALLAFQETLDEFPIDRERLYLTGLSMGGYGSWELGMNRPDWFAAIAPICGGADETTAHRLASTPLWVYHGTADYAVSVHRSRDMMTALHRAGGLPRYTEIPGHGHDSWVPAYQRDGVLNWMFAQRLQGMNDKDLSGVTALTSAHTPLRKGERIAFLGDSLTAAGVRKDGYITMLDEALKTARPDLGVHLIGAGISGHKVPDIQARLERDVLSYQPTCVFIFIGVNDVWHSQNGRGTSEGDYRSGLLEVISRIKNTGAEVVLATPPVIGEKRQGENPLDEMLEDYAQISRDVGGRMGATMCDFRQTMPAYLAVFNEKNAEKGILTTDRVHFNRAGNRFVANHAAMAIYEALAKRNAISDQ